MRLAMRDYQRRLFPRRGTGSIIEIHIQYLLVSSARRESESRPEPAQKEKAPAQHELNRGFAFECSTTLDEPSQNP